MTMDSVLRRCLGRSLDGVMAEQHRHHTAPEPSLIRIYLRFGGMPFLEVAGPSYGHGVLIREKGLPEPCEMGEYGWVTVDDVSGEVPYADCVGQSLDGVIEISGAPIGQAGYRFEFNNERSLWAVELFDDLVVENKKPDVLKHLQDITEREL